MAARTDAEHFKSERAREERETYEIPEEEAKEVADIFKSYGLAEKEIGIVVDAIRSDRKRWVDFMMKFELGIEAPEPKRARNSAITIAVSYMLGGLIPLAPYFAFKVIHQALLASVIVTLVALFAFGYVKGHFTVAKPLKSAWQTLAIGGAAASAAFVIAKLLS